MRVLSIQVRNLGCVRAETMECDQLTSLIGPNGSGKSTFLRAISLFFDANPALTPDDFYGGRMQEPISIELTLDTLRAEEVARFGARYVRDQKIVVERRFELAGGKTVSEFYGKTLRHAAFAPIREADGQNALKAQYNVLRAQDGYTSMPAVTKADDAVSAMAAWEAANPTQCSPAWDEGKFFTLKENGPGALSAHTTVVRLPAIRDATDEATEGRGAAITTLMDRAVRRAVVARAEFAQIQSETSARYSTLLDNVKAGELRTLEHDLANALQLYVPTAQLELSWHAGADVALPLPQALVRIKEDAYGATIDRCGHGVQRAFVLALLQQLASGGGAAGAGTSSDLIVLLEEPELFQHPSRQRHLSNVLRRLGRVAADESHTQVVLTTHSPLFLSLEHFHEIRLARKTAGPNLASPLVTQINSATLDTVRDRYAQARLEAPLTSEAIMARLLAISSPMTSEGFFAQTVVLVEGESDHAALAATAALEGLELGSQGIVVVPVGGKTNIALHLIVFESLKIPVFAIWDSDQGNSEDSRELNGILLRLRDQPIVDFPRGVGNRYACFAVDIETSLKEDIGVERFLRLVAALQTEYGMGMRHKDILKSQMLMRELIRRANEEGAPPTSLVAALQKIKSLHTTRAHAPGDSVLSVMVTSAPANGK